MHRPKTREVLGVSAFVFGAVACGGQEGAGAGDTLSVRDSAGIEIVTSFAPAWTRDRMGRVSQTPILSIGELDGPEALQFFDISDAARLSDGGVVVANAGSSELRVFDADGQHRVSLGGEGEGPGEFRAIAALDVTAGDSLVLWNRRLRRGSKFGPDGVFVGSFQLEPPRDGTFPSYEGRFGDGTLFVSISVFTSEPPEDYAVSANELEHWWYDEEGQPGGSIGSFPTGRMMLRQQTAGGEIVGFSFFEVPFDPATRFAPGSGTLFEGNGESFEIRMRDSDGRVIRIVRRIHDPVPMTSELVSEVFEVEWGDFPDRDYREFAREAYEAMPLPEHAAAFDRLLVEDSGRLWARHPAMPGQEVHSWSLFDSSGAWLGDLETPRALRPFDVGDGYILGLVRDELEVERVVLYSVDLP